MNIPEVATTAAIYSLAGLDEMQDFITEGLERFATSALEAALPHLEAALRKQIAADIRQSSIDMQEAADTFAVGSYSGTVALKADGMTISARIAEEGNTK